MPASREFYSITQDSISGIRNELNFILSRIADRLDKLEGVRGTATVDNALQVHDSDENIVHGFNVGDVT